MAINLRASDGTIKAVLTEDEILAILDAHTKKELQNGHQNVLGTDDVAGHVYLNTKNQNLVQRAAGDQGKPFAEDAYAEGEAHKAADAAHVHPLPTIEEIDEVSEHRFSKHIAKAAGDAVEEPEELAIQARGHVRLTDTFIVEDGVDLETVPEFADDVALRARTAARLIRYYDEKLAALGKGIRYYRSFNFAVVRSGTRLDERYSPSKVAERAGWTSEDEFMTLMDFSDRDTFSYYRARRTDETWQLAGSILTADQETPQEGTQVGVSEFFLDLKIDDFPLSDALCFPGFAVWSADKEGSTWDYYPDKTGVADNVSIVKNQTGQLSVKTIAATNSIADRTDFESTSRQRTYIEWITEFFRKIRGLRADIVDHTTKLTDLREDLTNESQQRAGDVKTLTDNLVLEVSAREDGDAALSNRITQESERLNASDEALSDRINQEATSREQADTSLQEQITAEVANRDAADKSIIATQDKDRADNTKAHSDITSALDSEIQRAKEAEGDLHGLTDKGAVDLVDAINRETERASTAEQGIRDSLSAYEGESEKLHDELSKEIRQETERAQAEELQIREDYAAADAEEASAREEADAALSGRIITNANRIGELQTALSTEQAARQTEDKNIRDELADEAKLRSDADGDFENLQTVEPHTNLVDAINDEIARAKSAESGLDSAIKEEKGRAEGAEKGLQSNITAEQNAREAADTEINNKIAGLTSDLSAKETELKDLVTKEETRATAAEEALQKNIESEQARAESVEGALSSLNEDISPASNLVDAINKETQRAETAESDLDERLKAEITRATTTEGDLQRLSTTDKTSLVAAINEERARALEAEGLTSSLLSSETLRAKNAEQDLTVAISDEADRAVAKEGELEQSIKDEVARATAAEKENKSAIDSEAQTRQAEDSKLQTSIDELSTSLESSNSELEEKIQGEIDRSVARDNEQEQKLNTEISDRAAADESLQNAIDDEAAIARAAEEALQTGKRDIVDGPISVAYTVSPEGVQSYLPYSEEVVSQALVQRTLSGSIVVSDPQDEADATNKRYVDTIHEELNAKDAAQDTALSNEVAERLRQDDLIRQEMSNQQSTLDETKLNREGPDTFTGKLTVEGSQTITDGLNVGADLTVSGNLYVAGTTTTVDSTNVAMEDNLLILNKNGVLPVTHGGIAIKVSAASDDNAYGLVYDLVTDTVKLGIGSVDEDGDFTFSDGEGTALSVREDSAQWTQNALAMWDESLNGFIHSAFTTEGTTLKTDKSMTLQSETVTVQSGTGADVQLNISGNVDVNNITAEDVAAPNVSAKTVKVEEYLQNKEGTVNISMPELDGTMAREEDVLATAQNLIENAKLVIVAI